jgi:hypothetical protein
MVVDSGETHEVSANVTIETSVPTTAVAIVRSRLAAEQHLINFGLAVPHDILLGKNRSSIS